MPVGVTIVGHEPRALRFAVGGSHRAHGTFHMIQPLHRPCRRSGEEMVVAPNADYENPSTLPGDVENA